MSAAFSGLSPGDMIEAPGHVATHLYTVTGVYYGALGQESLVCLEVLTKSDGAIGRDRHQITVPVDMLTFGIKSGLFKHTSKSNLDDPTQPEGESKP